MNWDAVSAISEIIGAIAVVVTLIYLAAQVRQSTRSIQSSTLQSNTSVWASMFCSLADKDMAAAYAVGMSGTPDIRPIQYTQFFLICRAMFVAFENQYYQYCQGTLDEPTYLGYERAIATQLMAMPGFRIWWVQSRDVFSPDFIEHVESMIDKTPEADVDALIDEWRRLAQRIQAES